MHKALAAVQVKNADRGEVTAVFSRFNVIDKDGDVTLPGAFTDGAEVPISAYGHTSWQGVLPVGKAVVRADASKAWVDAQFFMTTQAGRDTFEVVKQLGPLGQWSYGFDIADAEHGTWAGEPVRILRKLSVHEVSPVLVGAGVGTTTLSAKDETTARELARFVLGRQLTRQRREVARLREEVGR